MRILQKHGTNRQLTRTVKILAASKASPKRALQLLDSRDRDNEEKLYV